MSGNDAHKLGHECEKKGRRGVNEVTCCELSKAAEQHCKVDDGGLKLYAEIKTTSEDGGASGDVVVAEKRSCMCVPYGSAFVIGRKRLMEDALTVAPGVFASYDFFGVYDGHGGHKVAHTCRDRLPLLVAKEIEDGRDGEGRIDWEKVMTLSFSKMDEEINSEVTDEEDMIKSPLLRSMGTSAVVAVVGPEKVVVANCGDSRAVLYTGGLAVPLSDDHKAERPDEKARVESAGGKVINWNGFRVLGVLSTSRSIGDYFLRPYVISEPEVAVWERKETDDFLIIASDGFWDVVTNEYACKFAKKFFEGQIRKRVCEAKSGSCSAEAAALLTELAMARGSKDNISVLVVVLKNHECHGGLKMKQPNSLSMQLDPLV